MSAILNALDNTKDMVRESVPLLNYLEEKHFSFEKLRDNVI